ncbi:MAG: deoxyguanosinetriphosphate triphosphohydrolase [Bacteroidaceae bacterium]|nr:deoxyguanosinetriphosphate triphosphohydrolase [Bacteroidaceae bacterium]
MNWAQLLSNKRLGQEELHIDRKDDRTEFKRDYDRLIFSAPFRRLQNKTQVFPLPGSVFVHNRLTHSLEVASVGRSLGDDVARLLLDKHPELADTHLSEIGSIVSAACLAHDMGNPPFGHSGERAIASYFKEGNGQQYRVLMNDEEWADVTHFDGNANAFRLLTHTFKGRRPGGFVMTYATLAAIVKYPWPAIQCGKKPKFGFFQQEKESYRRIAEELGLQPTADSAKGMRHPLVYLVEAADDICYEIMDIEDAHKLRLLTTEETKQLLFSLIPQDHHARAHAIFEHVTDTNEQIVYLRSSAIGTLERECVRTFVEHEQEILDGKFTGSLVDHISSNVREAYERCQKVSVQKIYRSKDVLDIELAGYRIISQLIDLFTDAAMYPEKEYSKLLLARVSSQYEVDAPEPYSRIMAVLDYLSGMTDVFALDLYRKINGESLPMI